MHSNLSGLKHSVCDFYSLILAMLWTSFMLSCKVLRMTLRVHFYLLQDPAAHLQQGLGVNENQTI